MSKATAKQIDFIRSLHDSGKITDREYARLSPLSSLSREEASAALERATGKSLKTRGSSRADKPSPSAGKKKSAIDIVREKACRYRGIGSKAYGFREDHLPSGRLAEASAALTDMFGYPSFRPGQDRVVDAVLSGNDVLAIMPTGAGKSVCYQVPARMLGGLTLVVSPLISLMHDQVRKMRERGLKGSYVDSTLSPAQVNTVYKRALEGAYDVIYVSPERLETDRFLGFARQARIPFIAIDEAHCVSQWGGDFRPAYGRISDFVRALPHRPVVAAYTATATAAVRSDIARRLGLQNPVIAVSGFDRPNLSLQKEELTKDDRIAQAVNFVRGRRGQCGIIYCISRKDTDEMSSLLRRNGIAAVAYHAGMETEDRERNQAKWIEGTADVVVATSAFGMGIDKPDVRYVLSLGMADTLEAYYQQAGRAGRDGLPSECVLWWSPGDVRTWDFLIEASIDDADLSEKEAQAAKALKFSQLEQMVDYCLDAGCLRDHILRHFGEKAPATRCGRCSNCASRDAKKKTGTKTASRPRVNVAKSTQNENEWVCPGCHKRQATKKGSLNVSCPHCGHAVRLVPKRR